jgi:hypothetical protein
MSTEKWWPAYRKKQHSKRIALSYVVFPPCRTACDIEPIISMATGMGQILNASEITQVPRAC